MLFLVTVLMIACACAALYFALLYLLTRNIMWFALSGVMMITVWFNYARLTALAGG